MDFWFFANRLSILLNFLEAGLCTYLHNYSPFSIINSKTSLREKNNLTIANNEQKAGMKTQKGVNCNLIFIVKNNANAFNNVVLKAGKIN